MAKVDIDLKALKDVLIITQDMIEDDAFNYQKNELARRLITPATPFLNGLLSGATEATAQAEAQELQSKGYNIIAGIATDGQGTNEAIQITTEGIAYTVPYANRMNSGDNFNFTKDQHPEAQAHWEEVLNTTKKEQFENGLNELAIEYLKGGGLK